MSDTQTVALRRARPLLGTLVEVTAHGACQVQLTQAVDAAFDTIALVQRLMSFHDAASDVGRMNRLAYRVAVRVHPWTWEVLHAAQRLARASAGVFDVTVGGELMRLGYLPAAVRGSLDRRARWGDVRLLPGRRVRFARRLLIDLGGIAKGFAVDRAVQCLRDRGASAGLVNAGGDLRGFGPVAWRIHLRHPARPGLLLPFADLASGALATSAGYFSRRVRHGAVHTSILHGRRRVASTATFSASVAASNCMLADGLTKLVVLRGHRACGLVRRLGGRAFILRAHDADAKPLSGA
jgi:thiamine biosynthesis lipoprotein